MSGGPPRSSGDDAQQQCPCPVVDGMIYHDREICTDPIVSRLGWFAGSPDGWRPLSELPEVKAALDAAREETRGAAVSEFDEAVEAFRRKWGFDPTPAIVSAFRAGDFDFEGGTEDERAFLREVLTAGTDNTPIGLNCPGCGEPPPFMLEGGRQAFCGNDDCRFLLWDPTMTRAEMVAEGIHEIDLGGGEQA